MGDTADMRPRLLLVLLTLRSLSFWVGAAVLLALAGLLAVHRLAPPAVLRGSSDAAGNYLQTLGTIYAVLLAFVVFVVWQQFNEARAHIEKEANALVDLVRTFKGLSAEVCRPLLTHAHAYVRRILDQEWDAMAGCRDDILDGGNRSLDEMWNLLVAYEPCSECHKSLYGEALARFNDLSDERSNRLSSSRLRIPVALRLLLYFGAVLTVTSMYLFAVDRLEIHAMMTAALAGAIAHVLYLISDLDDCFHGVWQVPRAPFERAREYVTAALAVTSPGGAKCE
jgi:hypothetical protein